MKSVRIWFLAVVVIAGLSSVASAEPYSTDDRDITSGELSRFDGFLDSHPWVRTDLNRNPRLAEDPGYLATHREFRDFIRQHPGVREELRENPGRFVRAERGWDRREERRATNWRDGDHGREDRRVRDGDHDRDDRRGGWTNNWRDSDHDRDDRRGRNGDHDRDDRRARDRDHDRDNDRGRDRRESRDRDRDHDDRH